MTPIEAIEKHGLTVETKFVPLSRSRNAAGLGKDHEGKPSRDQLAGYCLNWTVTLKRDDRSILTTDYQAGIAHCPSYKQRITTDVVAAIKSECETGRLGKFGAHGYVEPPKAADIVHSLIVDSEVMDYATFEQWAAEFGYDPDSRKAESIYRACLDIALRLRAGLGDAAMAELREAFADY